MSILPKVEKGPYTTSDGPHYIIRKQIETWAQDGLVWVFDYKTGECNPYSVKQAENLTQTLITEYKKIVRNEENWKTSEEKNYQNALKEFFREAIEAFQRVIADARLQGDQNDPEVRREKLTTFLREKKEGTESKHTAHYVIQELFSEENKKDIIVFDKDKEWKSVDEQGRDKDTKTPVQVIDPPSEAR